jgi:hypothetical protein
MLGELGIQGAGGCGEDRLRAVIDDPARLEAVASRA